MRNPPGVQERDFASALREFERIVGKEWVFTSDEDLDLYRDAYSPLFGEPEERVASAAVAPDRVEQVQEIAKVANKYKIPIYPISTGRNLGYGGAAPNYSGSVVLDLKRMNRILDVSERNASCLVEPGVSYFDLCRYIEEKGYKVWVDVPDPGWGSLIGNALDHGGGYTMALYRNHFDAHCGMEVVLANGDIVRTGMGALPGAQTWQQFKYGTGPWVDGIFSQSNFGIVTKMGFWLMPTPDAYLSASVNVRRYQDLIPLVDLLTYIENAGVSNGMPTLGSPLLAGGGILGGPPRDPELGALLATPGGPSPEAIDAYGEKRNIPCWRLNLAFYGPAKAIAAQWEHAKEKFSQIPGSTFQDGEVIKLPLSAEQRERVHKPEFGIPSLEMFSIGARSELNPNPTNGHMWFSPIIPRTGEAVFEASRVFRQAGQELSVPIGATVIPTMYWLRAFVLIVALPITRNIETNRKNRAAMNRLIQMAAEHGWGEYRTPPVFQDVVMKAYSFNDNALLRLHETIKDAVDPNGIISAGRYGIWPKHLRGTR
jgi:4-cresol dehydrogenase (hydroxylating)